MQYRTLGKDLTVSAVGLVAFSPLANGFLTARYTAESKFDPKEDYRSTMPQFTKKPLRKTKNFWHCLKKPPKPKTPRRGKFHWRGCLIKSLTLYQFPAHAN